jgi:hypothetical protein
VLVVLDSEYTCIGCVKDMHYLVEYPLSKAFMGLLPWEPWLILLSSTSMLSAGPVSLAIDARWRFLQLRKRLYEPPGTSHSKSSERAF